MAVTQIALEVERVVNLVTAFGWEKVEEKKEDDFIILTVRKRLVPEAGF